MKVLKLSERFYGPVKRGLKTATTRKSDKGLASGDIVHLAFGDSSASGKSLLAAVESVDRLKFGEIALVHAESENHQSVASFKKSLREFYPDLDRSSDVYYIKFKLLD